MYTRTLLWDTNPRKQHTGEVSCTQCERSNKVTFERFRFLAPCQRLRAIVCVLSAHLRRVLKSTCVCLRLREQCLRSEITSVSRVAHVLLLRLVATDLYNWIACGVCSIIVWLADNVPPSLCSTSACAVQFNCSSGL